MATKRQSCNWCGMPGLVPLAATSLYCPACHRYTWFQRGYDSYLPYGNERSDYNGYYLPQGRGRSDYNNGYHEYRPIGNVEYSSNDRYETHPANPSYGRVYQPGSTGSVYRVQPQLQSPPATAHGPKRAVLCGITYKGNRQSLSGSINDVMLMKKLLVERFRFPNASIILLTEEQHPSRIPTKKNIRAALQWLVQGCQPGDSLVFHYSGHGSQVRDRDGDELDGYDESLLPVDYETEGRILDDELNATIVRPLPGGATLHSIIDTCFSGTFLDLPNVCRIIRDGYYKWEDHRVPHAFKGTSGGYAICISACDDHQNSGDTTAFTGKAMGALTYSFVQTMEQQPRLTYGHLLLTMHNRISTARQRLGIHSSQEPQLSSSHKFDIHSKTFTL